MKWDSIRAAVDLHFWNWGRKDEKRVSNTSNERLWAAYFSVAQALIYPAHSLLCLCAVCITIMHPLHSVSSSISFPSAWPHPMEVLRSEHFHLGNFKLFLPESAVITRVLSHFPVGTETRQVWLLQEDLSCNIRAQGQRHLKLGWTLAHTGLLATPLLVSAPDPAAQKCLLFAAPVPCCHQESTMDYFICFLQASSPHLCFIWSFSWKKMLLWYPAPHNCWRGE